MGLSRRAIVGLTLFAAVALLAIAVVGAAGIHGVRAADRSARAISDDELATSTTTGRVGRVIGRAAVDGAELVAAAEGRRPALGTRLYERDIPAVEAAFADLDAIHADDDAAEKRTLAAFRGRWDRLRARLNALPARIANSRSPAQRDALAGELTAAFEPVSAGIESLTAREVADAAARNLHASGATDSTILSIVYSIIGAVILLGGLLVLVARRIRQAVEPSVEQTAFADTLQLAEDEGEAHMLLKRHLERAIRGVAVTVLNRNNSADRLEAKTPLREDAPLAARLEEARPNSCLAVRSGRIHRSRDGEPALLECVVCASCPGDVLCNPLTVGGQIIGSVLMNRGSRFGELDEHRIRDSVSQAAPVLANLRNLAIAELRASTDSLTGLPNKRAVEDTMKQMLAQATRAGRPLALLVLDLDHFKDINDRFGHGVGDSTLANVGAAITSALRDGDFAGRSGGEEFVILLAETATEGACEAAERIRAAISAIAVPGDDRTLTASVGVAAYPDHAGSLERLERLADAALYVAKRSGRDRVEVASTDTPPPPLAEAALSRLG
jgi:diguanylate cyclase (GGDEF)-like protein